MNPLDWALIALLVYSAVRAALRGFVVEAFSLGGLLIGFPLACWYYHPLAGHLSGLIQTPLVGHLTAFLLIIFGVMLLAGILGRLVRRTVAAVGLGGVDRLLGALFGLARGALLGFALLCAIVAFLPASPWIAHSQLAPYFLSASHAVSSVMPQDLGQRLREGLERTKHIEPRWIKS